MNFEKKYEIVCELIIIINRMNNAHAKCMSLRRLIAQEANPINMQAASKQLYEAAKDLTELKIEYLRLRNSLDREAGCSDVWALDALDKLSNSI